MDARTARDDQHESDTVELKSKINKVQLLSVTRAMMDSQSCLTLAGSASCSIEESIDGVCTLEIFFVEP